MAENQTKVNFAEIANSAKNLAKQYRSVLAIVDAIEQAGALDAYCDDLHKRIADLEQQSAAASAQLVEVRNELSIAKDALESNKNEAAAIKENAVKIAETAAEQIKKAAETSIAADKKKADGVLAAVNKDIADGENELIVVQGKLIAANNELERVNKLIAEVKAKF